MKGAVLIAFNDMVVEQYGIDIWEELLAEVDPESGGVFTSTENYADAEIFAFISSLSNKLKRTPADITRVFGRFLFVELNTKFPIFTKLGGNLFRFLESVESVIHREVNKLYDNPSLPTIDCQVVSDKRLNLIYKSPRKLCYLAEGLIFGAADFFGDEIEIQQSCCLHRGDDHCLITVQINDQ